MLMGRRLTRVLGMVGLLAPVVWCAPAHGVQHLVKPGDQWQFLIPRVKPGDEVILMPGRHRDASIESLMGTAKKPIVIRGADPDDPPVIEAEREGIRIKRAAHLTIKNVKIVGGTIAGISITDPLPLPPASADPSQQAPAEESGVGIVVQNVSITKVGPRGQRHALVLTGLRQSRVQDCTFEGWGGSAIEVVACREIAILRCAFTGIKDFTQHHGIRVRAGSDRVLIESCRFDNAGERVVSFGGMSESKEFRPPPPGEAGAGKVAEATRVSVERSIIKGGRCAVTYVHADDCLFRNNTILRPKICPLALLSEHEDPRFTAGQRNIFGLNIIVWEPGDLQRLIEIGPRASSEKFLIESNVWWSGQPQIDFNKLGPFPGNSEELQMLDVDPKLNDKLKPTHPGLSAFGA